MDGVSLARSKAESQ